jgi:hypothetical protein
MAIKTFTTGEVLTAADTNTYLANSGLVFVSSTTIGSAVATVTVTNAFSATYDSYRVMVNTTCSASSSMSATLGNGGSFSATGYNNALIYLVAGTGGVQEASTLNGSQFSWLGGGTANQAFTGQFDINNPFQAKYTKVNLGVYTDNNAYGTMNGEHKVATSYADIRVGSGGTFTGGTITVYGYRKA